MAKFQVPQFIEEEAKIIGPLTLRQFAYIGTAAGLAFIAFYTFSLFFALVITAIAGAIGAGLAFVKLEGQPLPKLIFAFLKFWQRPNKYVWKRRKEMEEIDTSSMEKIEAVRQGMSFQNRIKSAARNIATGSFSFFKEFKKQKSKEKPKDQYQVVTHVTGEKSKAKRVDYTQDS